MDIVMVLLMVVTYVAIFAGMIFLLWVWPIRLGLKEARTKNYSPAWMWFGVHPLGGWIMFTVLRYWRPRIQCASCGALVKDNFTRCPVCHGAVLKSATTNPE